MHALNLQVIQKTCDWLQQGDRVYFITVVNTWGASPRPIGSLFSYNLDKEKQVGSLSGGCIESDLFDYLKALVNAPDNKLSAFLIKKYGDIPEESARYLLPCGGTMELFIEPLFDSSAKAHFLELKRALSLNQPIVRSLDLSEVHIKRNSVPSSKHVIGKEELVYNKASKCFYHRLDPIYRLLLVGVGDVSLYLCELAQAVGFDVTICDPRAEYRTRFHMDNLPCNVSYELPDEIVRRDFDDSFSGILCLAHDPKVDDMALMEALVNSKAFYVGAMGSVKTTEARLDRLKRLGLTSAQLSRLHAPVGLDIHSKTPQEIAISISAELIALRYQSKYQP